MAYTDLEALKERIKASKTAPKPKRKYRKKPTMSATKRVETIQALRDSAQFVDEAVLERDAKTWQAYKQGLTLAEMAEALGCNLSALSKRIQRLKERLGTK